LRDRSFRLLFSAQFASLIGTGMAPIAVAFAVIGVHRTPAAMSIVLAARMLPTVLLMLVGGVIADRLPRHRVIMAADIVCGIAQAATALALVFGFADLWTLTALQFVGGAAGAFLMPAVSGLVPQIVDGPYCKEANALIGVSRNGAKIGGAALGGVIVATAGPGLAIGIDAASFFLSALLLRSVRLRLSQQQPRPRKPFASELIEGWHEFRARRWVWLISAQYAVTNALGMGSFFVLGPLVADRSLGGPASWGLIITSNAGGLVFGSLASLQIRLSRPLLAAPIGAFFIVPVVAFLALGAPPLVICAGAFLLGFTASISGVFFETALQRHVPPDKLSRVTAYDIAASFSSIPLGVIVVGVLATQLGIAATLWVAAVAVALAGIATLVAQDVRAIGVESEPAPPPETMPRSRGVAARYAASQATPT
jgi:predicted MFS family arabinose efflux permease